MRPKRDIKQQIEDAVKDFKTLVIYFNITRPQYESTFKDGGEFSTKKLTNIAHYLSKGTKGLTKEELHRYNKLSAVYNYTFGVPSELVKKVLGYITDDAGKHHKIPPTKIIEHLIATGFLDTPINAGKKVKKADDKYKVVCYWHKKYPLKNEKYMFQLMSDKRYSKIETFPNASERVKKIILKWHGEQMPKKADDEPVKNDSTLAVKPQPQTKNLNSDVSQSETNNDFASRFRKWVKAISVAKGFVKEMGMFDGLADYQVMEVYETMKKAVERDDVGIIDNIGLRYEEGIVELMKHVWHRRKNYMKARQSKEVA